METNIYNAIIDEVINRLTEPDSIYNMRIQVVVMSVIKDAIEAVMADNFDEKAYAVTEKGKSNETN